MELRWIALAGMAGAAALSATQATAAPRHSVAAKDWTRTVSATPAGGFRMGNPAAKVKLVEYGSLSCPHCALFAAEGTEGVRALVKSGKLSFEFRNFVRNRSDAAASLLAGCGGAATFFPVVDAMYESQEQWTGAIIAFEREQKGEIDSLPLKERVARLAEAGGLPQLAAKAGVPAAKAKQCLADEAAMAGFEKATAAGVKLGVTGTPSFFINGSKATAFTWADLEPDLRRAIAAGG